MRSQVFNEAFSSTVIAQIVLFTLQPNCSFTVDVEKRYLLLKVSLGL